MGNCAITAKTEPCQIRMKIFGLDYNFNSFMVSSKPGEQIASYWASEQLISHNQLLMKPERGGTRFSFVYVMEVPQAMSTEGTNLIMSMTNLPQYIEKVLTEIKNNVEGTG